MGKHAKMQKATQTVSEILIANFRFYKFANLKVETIFLITNPPELITVKAEKI
jgi:hypothetical protein